MELKYTTQEQDFLNSYLYVANHTPQVIRQRRNTILILAGFGALATMFFFFRNDKGSTFYFLAFTIITAVVYPFYQRYFYKKQYLKHIRANNHALFGKETVLTFNDTRINGDSSLGSSSIPYESVKEICEIKELYLIRLLNNSTVVISKRDLSNTEKVTEYLKTLAGKIGVPYIDALNWKWK